MGMMDKAKNLKDQATDAMQGHEDKIDDVADKADDATGNKHTDKIDKAAEMAKDQVKDPETTT